MGIRNGIFLRAIIAVTSIDKVYLFWRCTQKRHKLSLLHGSCTLEGCVLLCIYSHSCCTDLILSCIFLCFLSSAFLPPTCWLPWCHRFPCDLSIVLILQLQCRRSTVCRSPAWLNVYGELQSALSWRTTVCRYRGRRSLRRCRRRHWQNTTSAVCWTRLQTLTWAPGKSIKTTQLCTVHINSYIDIGFLNCTVILLIAGGDSSWEFALALSYCFRPLVRTQNLWHLLKAPVWEHYSHLVTH